MKITWSHAKGVCLLLLGLVATSTSRGYAADVTTINFTTLEEAAPDTVAPSKPAEKVSPFVPEATSPATLALASTSTHGCEGCGSSCASDIDCYSGAPGRFWFHGDYVRWWTRGQKAPPLVSTVTNLNDPLNIASLRTVFGDQRLEDGSHEGYRVNLGMWLDCCHTWGIEGDYLDISQKSQNYDSGNTPGYDNNGNVFPIVRAFYEYDPTIVANNGSPINLDAVGYPSNYYGRVTVHSSDYFQTAGVWLRRQLKASEWSTNNQDICWTDGCARTFRMDAIVGYRYARLIDIVNIRDEEINIDPTAVVPGNNIFLTNYTFADNFGGVNQFHGADIGINSVFTAGRWSFDVTTKMAVGNNHQLITQDGLAIVNASTRGGGVQQFAGHQEFTRDMFSVIPELTFTTGFQFNDHLKLTVGYDLLYWANVARGAENIQVQPGTGLPYGTGAIPANVAAPAFVWNEGCYFAQGLRLGGEFRY